MERGGAECGRGTGDAGAEAETDRVLLDVTDVGDRGQGIGRVDGLVVFVPGALPGDAVEALITRRRRRHAEARLLRVVRPAPARVEPPCPVQSECGGCPLMALESGAALALKVRHLEQTLRRIGGATLAADETIASPRALRYRGRVRFAVAPDGRGRRPAYRAAGDPRRLVPVTDCPIGPPGAAAAAEAVLAAVGRATPVDEIEVRASNVAEELLVVLHGTAEPDARLRAAARAAVRGNAALAGVSLCRGRRVIRLAGARAVRVRLGDVELDVGPAGFVQVNPGAAALLYDAVARDAGAGPGDAVLDLYSGAGLAALAAVRGGARALGIEADRSAVEAGASALGRHPAGGRVRLARGDAGRELARLAGEDARFDVVIANPPRGGLAPGVARGIAALQPRRVVLVSCHAATLARDVASLAEHGLRAARLTAIDMFPGTAHLEAVVRLDRDAGAGR